MKMRGLQFECVCVWARRQICVAYDMHVCWLIAYVCVWVRVHVRMWMIAHFYSQIKQMII